MYTIKQLPEDFIVKEVSNVRIGEKGPFSYYLLKKRNRNTMDAVNLLSKKLRINKKFIGFAGNKDKKAVTEQIISIKKCNIKNLKQKDLEITLLGKGDERINLGDLEGNEFIITVRNLEKERELKINKIINYFDEQRFGKDSNNIRIGKALIKKDFKKAIELVDNREINEYLKKNKNDFVNALRIVNTKLLRLYVHSYQSYLWNIAVEQAMKNKTIIKDGAFIGSGTIFVAPVTVGRKAITGAGSVVTKNTEIPSNSVVVGMPARVLKKTKR